MSKLRFTIYECDVCKREIEVQLDGTRPDPSRCNITLKCRGHLKRQGERSTKKFLFTPIVAGLEDYVPRGTPETVNQPVSSTKQISIFTAGGTGMLTAAVLKRKVAGFTATFYVVDENGLDFDLESKPTSFTTPVDSKVTMQLFEITPELLAFKKYTYVINGNVQLVRGGDDSPEGRNLRFNVNNKLRVFVNGVELIPTQYDRTIDDQITLTPLINGVNNVIEILVYNDIDTVIDAATLIPVTFEALLPTNPTDLAFRELNCWGNFGGVTIDAIPRYTLFFTGITLDPEKTYGVARIEATSEADETRTIRASEFNLMLGHEPFANQDKELNAYLTGSELIDNDATISYLRSPATGALVLSVDETNLKQLFIPLVPFLRIAAAESGNLQGGTETAQESEAIQHQYILGPS